MGILFVQTIVGLQRIAIERRSGFDILAYQRLQGFLFAPVDHAGANLAAALQNRRDYGLAFRSAPSLNLAGLPSACMFRAFAPIKVSSTSTSPESLPPVLGSCRASRILWSMCHAHFLSDPQRAVKFPRANAVLHVGLHPNRGKPLVETQRGIFHDGSDLHGELGFRMPRLALPQAARRYISYVLRSTGRTDNAVLPFGAMRQEVRNTVIGVRKVEDCVLKSLGFACHEPILRQVA